MRRAPIRAAAPVLLAMAAAVPAAISTLLGAAGCRRAAPPAAESPATAPTRLGLSIADLADDRVAPLRAAAAAAHVELVVGGATVGVKPQPLQVAELLEAKVGALLLVPSSPDLLHAIGRTVSAKSVPLVAIGRGDGRVGAWVGLKSGTLAKEAGAAAGRALKREGRTKPRVIVVESSRWPETSRRIEATLKGIEAECGSVEVPVRLTQCETRSETERMVGEGIAGSSPIDLIVAADPTPTAAAWSAVEGSPAKGRTWVVGVSDDDAFVEKARDAGARLIVVAWKREELGRRAIDAALAAMKGDAS